jgi:DMSO/TMAO reductase YedYZ molybdopterin-dependent catalytic subunit
MGKTGRLCAWCLLMAPALWGFGGCAKKGAGGDRMALGKARQDSIEIKEYDGLPLDTFFREYDNSIQGPQKVDAASYRLEIRGLVETPRKLTYEEVLSLPPVKRAITLYCVEGWKERLLFEGVSLKEVLALAGPKSGVKTIIFYGVDGYSTALPYADVERLDLMLASRINGLVLDGMRGFPFQLVAQSKLGYKWIKWLNGIELSDQPYVGFWEKRGYSDQADVPQEWLEEK